MKHPSIAGFGAALATLLMVAFLSVPASAQAQSQNQNQGPPANMIDPATIPCTACHNATTLIVSKEAQFRLSKHGSGDAYVRGASADCAGCHGSEGAKARINAHLNPHDPSIKGIVNVSPYNCRTCHNIHMTYTKADFALTGGEEPVKMETTGTQFNGGAGNLCANCHQIRNPIPVASDGMIEVTSQFWGTHHAPNASMMLGEGGLGVKGRSSVMYRPVQDSCVFCHMGTEHNHTFEAKLERCQGCHEDAKSFDMDGVQTDVKALLDEVKTKLVAHGVLNADNGRAVPGTYPEAIASALWDYIYVVEDKSDGVHNPDYTKKLLKYASDQL
jgi:hypothetical protein